LRSKQKLIDEARIAKETAGSDVQSLKKGVQQDKQTEGAIEKAEAGFKEAEGKR
jgi:hypothetical protein